MNRTGLTILLITACSLVHLHESVAQEPESAVPGGKIQPDTTVYERRPFQFTFLFPPLSTNGVDNFRIVNDVSLNLFVGVSGGVEAFEAGGFINVDRFYVRGVQLAGFGNTVGGEVSGLQLAGFYNVAGTRMKGFQGAGFINVNGGTVTGVQAAGFASVSGGSLSGLQASGFLNVSGAVERGVQAAGFGNVAGRVEGVQAAGFLNVAGDVKGVQLAGFINYCDSIDGVPVGFINVVRKNGYRRIGLSVSEVQYAGLQYRMGVQKLYTIYSFGKPFGPGSRWMYGAGLGTEMILSDMAVLNIEATVEQELWIGNPSAPYFLTIDRLNLHNSIRFLFGWYLDERISLHLGPTFNVSVAESNPGAGNLPYYEIAPYAVYNQTRNDYGQTHTQIWFGIQGGIRF